MTVLQIVLMLLVVAHSKLWRESVTELKYLGVTFSHRNTLLDGLEVLCQQAHRAQSVVDLHILKHETVLVQYIVNLFDILVKPILIYGSEVYGLIYILYRIWPS